MKSINSFFYNIYDLVYLNIIQELDNTIDNIYIKRIAQVWLTVIILLAVIGITYSVFKVFVLHLIFGLSL
jgi:hypothetical protein